jgi:hypothetical protein
LKKGCVKNLLAISCILVFIQCWNPFAPKITNSIEGSDLVITQQKSPKEVLQNFKMAYIFKDSLLYSDVLDTAFLFVYFDPNAGTSGRFESWERDVDLITTGRLFRHFQVVDLVWNEAIYEWSNQIQGEINQSFNLSLISMSDDYRFTGRAAFSFRKCQDEKWRITRWKDESDL